MFNEIALRLQFGWQWCGRVYLGLKVRASLHQPFPEHLAQSHGGRDKAARLRRNDLFLQRQTETRFDYHARRFQAAGILIKVKDGFSSATRITQSLSLDTKKICEAKECTFESGGNTHTAIRNRIGTYVWFPCSSWVVLGPVWATHSFSAPEM
jgi:hypothetical protein